MEILEPLVAVLLGYLIIKGLLERFDETAFEDGFRVREDWFFCPARWVRASLWTCVLVSAGLLISGLNAEVEERPDRILLWLYAAGIVAPSIVWPPSIVLTPSGVVKRRWGIKGPTLPYEMIADFHEDDRGGVRIVSVTGKPLRIPRWQAGLSQMQFLLTKRVKKSARRDALFSN